MPQRAKLSALVSLALLAMMPFANRAKAGEDSCHFPQPFRVVTPETLPASIHEAIVKDGLDSFWAPRSDSVERLDIGGPVTEIGWQRKDSYFVWTLTGDTSPPFRIVSTYRVKSADGPAVLVKRTSLQSSDARACRETLDMLRRYGGR